MIKAFDHVAVPMESVDAMLSFYRTLGCNIVEEYQGFIHAVYFGDNKINFHAPVAWQSEGFSLRGNSALPGCGDFCFVWQGSQQSLCSVLNEAGVAIEEGPVERVGGRGGGTNGTSVYVRDPDRNLLEFIIYE